MSYENNDILFEKLGYGAYILDYPVNPLLSENVKYAGADFNKLYVRRVRLPDGKGNIIYLLTSSFDNSLRMVSSQNFIVPPTYRRFFYPWISMGTFMGRRYKMDVTKDRQRRVAAIGNRTSLRPYPTRFLQKSSDNVFFCAADLYNIVTPIMERYPIKRNFEEFFQQFSVMLKKFTPEDEKVTSDKSWNNKILLIDGESFNFKNGAPLKENQTNPLFLIYLAFLRSRDLSKLNIDIDMMICSKNMFIKFNPARVTPVEWPVFRRALFRIMNANLDDYTARLSVEDKTEIDTTGKEKLVNTIINDVIDPYTKMVSPETKSVLTDAIGSSLRNQVQGTTAIDQLIKHDKKEIAKTIGVEPIEQSLFASSLPKSDTGKSLIGTNPVIDPLSIKREKLFKAINNMYEPLATTSSLVRKKDLDADLDDDFEEGPPLDEEDEESSVAEFEDDIKDDVNEILTADEEVLTTVLDEIQDKTAPLKNLKTAPLSSPRDQKLREAQKKVVLRSSTIEEILDRDVKNIPIESSNKSAVMKTSNKNMHNIKFANFDKTYINEVYTKDIVACFDMLKDKESPFYITSIDVKDTSTSMDLKETWTVKLVDENKKSHTIKVDIPKFYNDRFMLINGIKYIILKQNLYNPLVKDAPDTVILTTNHNKITIRRKSTKSLTGIERIFSLLKKTGDGSIFVSGDSTKGNMRYLSSLEYDELSRRIFKFVSNGCEIYFSRDYIQGSMADKIPNDIKGDEFFIGMEGNTPILIHENTGLDRSGRTISDIIENNLSPEHKIIFNATKPPAQSMYAEGKLAGEFIPIVVTLVVWIGLSKTLDKLGIKWNFDPEAKRVPVNTPSKKYIRFADGVLEYESKTYAELILNGLTKLHPSDLRFSDFDTPLSYEDYIYAQWGSYNGITELKTFYEFLMDTITVDVCKDFSLPTKPDELLIYAVKLLCDNACVPKAYDNSYRTRSEEMIPAILYSCLANQYKSYVKSGRRLPMTLSQRCVITRLTAEKTVEAYSTLNPAIEVAKTHTISSKGFRGSNSDHSYDEKKRSYDPSAIGKIAISTSADANVGINRELVVEPTISNARGYREQVSDVNTLMDVNIFSPVELLTPGTARNDDPIRTSIAEKQSQHLVSTMGAEPSLVSNGFDEALQFHLSDDFVINAEEDGKVVEINPELGFIMVEYKSGKTKAISTKPEVVKNSGGGFYTTNILKPTVSNVGDKFKKDEPLAYHDKYFRYSKMNGLRYAIGPVAKVAYVSSYNSYEDAGISTKSLANKMKTNITYEEKAMFKRNVNIIDMVKVGDHVNIGDSLIRFDASVEDNELAKYLSKLSEESAGILEEETRRDVKTNHAGTIVKILVSSLMEPSNLSPSLGKIVQQYFDEGINKREFLNRYDNSDGIIKSGYLLTDSTEPIVDRYNSLEGNKGIDVLIKIYIEHPDVLGVGDKIALYSANKQIVSEVIPEGYEPFSEFRPKEEVSVISSPGTIARRMTPSVIPISAAMKVQIELKRKIKTEIRYK